MSPNTLDAQESQPVKTGDVRSKSVHLRRMDAGDWSDIVAAILVAAGMIGGLIWFVWHYTDPTNSPILVLAGLLGASSGWVMGILLSPYNSDEGRAFGDMTKLIYGFLSGYVLSKFDPILTDALKPGAQQQWVVACFGLISFLIAVALTYITRRYWTSSRRS